MAAALPPHGFPKNSEFLRVNTTRFISLPETLLSMGTVPSEQNTLGSIHWLRAYLIASAIGWRGSNCCFPGLGAGRGGPLDLGQGLSSAAQTSVGCCGPTRCARLWAKRTGRG